MTYDSPRSVIGSYLQMLHGTSAAHIKRGKSRRTETLEQLLLLRQGLIQHRWQAFAFVGRPIPHCLWRSREGDRAIHPENPRYTLRRY